MKRDKRTNRRRRHWRVRSRVNGTAQRPRLTVFRSNKFISAQVVDDEQGKTLVSASSSEKDMKAALEGKTGNIKAAEAVGKAIAERARAKGVSQVCFDRSGYKYHGRVKALANAARGYDPSKAKKRPDSAKESGLEF